MGCVGAADNSVLHQLQRDVALAVGGDDTSGAAGRCEAARRQRDLNGSPHDLERPGDLHHRPARLALGRHQLVQAGCSGPVGADRDLVDAVDRVHRSGHDRDRRQHDRQEVDQEHAHEDDGLADLPPLEVVVDERSHLRRGHRLEHRHQAVELQVVDALRADLPHQLLVAVQPAGEGGPQLAVELLDRSLPEPTDDVRRDDLVAAVAERL